MGSPPSMMPGRISYRVLAKTWIAIRPVRLVWPSVSTLARAASQPSVGRANLHRPKCLSGTLRAQGQRLSNWDAWRTPPSRPAARPVPTGIALETGQKDASESESPDSPGDSLTLQRPLALRVPWHLFGLHFSTMRGLRNAPRPRLRGQAPMFRSGRCKRTGRSRRFWWNSL